MTAKIESIHLWKKLLFGLLLITAMAILSACGGKINTTINMENDQKGVRVMQVVYDASNDDVKRAFAEKDKLDASINRNIPKQLVYKGVTSNKNSYVVTFELPFNSIDEYQQKINQIIGSKAEYSVSIKHLDSPLVKGVIANEQFTSEDLLGWLETGLVQDGLVSSQDASYIIDSTGPVVLNIGGQSYKSNYRLDVRNGVLDNGFSSVLLSIDTISAKKPTATIYYLYDIAPGAEKENLAKKFFKGALPADSPAKPITASDIAESSHVLGDNGFKVVLTADSMEKLNPLISKALGQKKAALTFGKVSIHDNELYRDIKSTFDCDALCSPLARGFSLEYKINPLSPYQSNDGGFSISSEKTKDGKKYTLITSEKPFDGKLVATPVALKETIAAVAHGKDKFSVRVIREYPKDTEPDLLDKLKTVFEGIIPENKVSVDGTTVIIDTPNYTADEISTKIDPKKYGVSVSVDEAESGWFNTYYLINIKSTITNYSQLQDSISIKIIGEGSASLVDENGLYGPSELVVAGENRADQEPSITAKVKAINWIAWIILLIFLALLFIACIVALIFRKKIAAQIAKFKQQRLAQAQAQAQFMAQQQAQQPMQPPVQQAQQPMQPPVQQAQQPMQPPVQQAQQPMQPPVQQAQQPMQPPVQQSTSLIPPVMDDDDENDLD